MAKKTFEQSLKLLENIVSELESDDIPIESALKKFEEGVELSNYCARILDETEKKVTQLLKNQDDKVKEVPFLENNTPDDETSG